jgi:peptidoglycan biosynthesis protein MviN/MurJ (putative lipid II flippase)
VEGGGDGGEHAGTVGGSATLPATPAAEGEKQAFVPFFNEEYRFQGGVGDVSIAYRLGAIFILMLIAAAMMYLGAWWWVGTHPLAHH